MTQAQIKFIRSLSRQKYRKAHNAYLVEGRKNAKEWLASKENIQTICATPDWFAENSLMIKNHPKAELVVAKESELERISTLTTAQSVILVVGIPSTRNLLQRPDGWSLYLENIRNPGNMGTIIRIADWFGIQQIFHSENCVEIYNPKVVQASMGSLVHVNLQTCSVEKLNGLISSDNYPLYAATLNGKDLHQIKLKTLSSGILAVGNESDGLSEAILNKAIFKIRIPGKGRAESLNVGVATGILCAWLTQSL